MVWTYSGNPKASPKDEVRFLIGDTDANDQLLQDAEINYVLSVSPDPGAKFHNMRAASQAAATIASKFAREADKTVGSLHLSNSQRYQHYFELANALKDASLSLQSGRPPGGPELGGGGRTYLGGEWP